MADPNHLPAPQGLAPAQARPSSSRRTAVQRQGGLAPVGGVVAPPGGGGVQPSPITPGPGAARFPSESSPDGLDNSISNLGEPPAQQTPAKPQEIANLVTTKYEMPNGGVLEVIDHMQGGAVGDISIIYLTHPPKAGQPPLRETRVMKEINIHKKQKCQREKAHFLRHPAHPNIIRYVYWGPAIGKNANTHEQVQMELMDLGSLRRVLHKTESTGSLNPFDRMVLAINAGFQVLAGLDYYHHFFNGMHRDVKPENILVNSKGRVRLCDFDTSIEEASNANTLLGTELYMAPEMFMGNVMHKQYEKQCDLWGLGMILYEIATGEYAFQEKTMARLMAVPEAERFQIKAAPLREKIQQASQIAVAGKAEAERLYQEASTAVKAIQTEEQQRPYHAQENAAKRRIMLCKDTLEALAWFEDLLNKLLDPSPETRATTTQAMAHPFFKSVHFNERNIPKYGEIVDEIKEAGVPLDHSDSEYVNRCWRFVVKGGAATAGGESPRQANPSAGGGIPLTFEQMAQQARCTTPQAPAGGGFEDEPVSPHGEAMATFKATKHIKDVKTLSDRIKDVLFVRQKFAVDRLEAFCREKSDVLRPVLHDEFKAAK